MRKFVNKLNRFCEELHSKYLINSGGCCFVAYLIAKELYKRNIKYKVVIGSYDKQLPSLELRHNIKNNYGFPCNEYVACHYWIKIGKYEINKMPKKDYIISQCACIKSEHLYNLYLSGDWNDEYDTSNNDIIECKIYDFFRNYSNLLN